MQRGGCAEEVEQNPKMEMIQAFQKAELRSKGELALERLNWHQAKQSSPDEINGEPRLCPAARCLFHPLPREVDFDSLRSRHIEEK